MPKNEPMLSERLMRGGTTLLEVWGWVSGGTLLVLILHLFGTPLFITGVIATALLVQCYGVATSQGKSIWIQERPLGNAVIPNDQIVDEISSLEKSLDTVRAQCVQEIGVPLDGVRWDQRQWEIVRSLTNDDQLLAVLPGRFVVDSRAKRTAGSLSVDSGGLKQAACCVAVWRNGVWHPTSLLLVGDIENGTSYLAENRCLPKVVHTDLQ